MHRLAKEQQALLEFTARSQTFVEAIRQNENLQSQARTIRDELAQVAAQALAACVG